VGLAVLEAIAESDFAGRLVVFFQPAEETGGGGHPMAESAYADDLDYLLAVHVGLDHPTGEVVAGGSKPLAMAHLDATIEGTSARRKAPNEGDNAMQAMGTAIVNAYGISRHADGMTRVNVGWAEAGTASNVIAERAQMEAEARGETTELMEFMKSRFERTARGAATMHGCRASVDVVSESPRADSDPELQALVTEVAAEGRRRDRHRAPGGGFRRERGRDVPHETGSGRGRAGDVPHRRYRPPDESPHADVRRGRAEHPARRVDVLVGTIRDLEQRHPVPQVEDETAIRSQQD